jgi:ABC-type lipoprotein release transport system permease subunit
VLASLLYDTSPLDPPTFVVVALALAACATIASTAPSLRAARVDPLIALRNE